MITDEMIGLRKIGAMFDTERDLRLDLEGIEWLEEHVLEGGGRAIPIAQIMISLGRFGFLKKVLRVCLGMSTDPKKPGPVCSDKEANGIIEGYIQNTGSLQDLQALLNDVYTLATTNPIKLRELLQVKKELSGGKQPILDTNSSDSSPPSSTD